MESIASLKAMSLTVLGIICSAVIESLGGCDKLLVTLVTFMITDMASGWLVAGVFKTSDKTESGRLASGAGLRGLLKKGGMLLMVLVAVRLDNLMETNGFTRNAVIIAFILNELLSIIENMGLMGIKAPNAIMNAIELLNKSEHQTKNLD